MPAPAGSRLENTSGTRPLPERAPGHCLSPPPRVPGLLAIKGHSHTPNNFLKPKHTFHGVEHFLSVFSSVKAVTLFKQKQHLGLILALGF